MRSSLRLVPLLVLYVAICAIQQPDYAVRDEPDLLVLAEALLDGHLIPPGEVVNPREYLWHGPGLVVLLAPFVALDLPLEAIRYIQPLLLFAAVLLFHRVLLARLPARAALGWPVALGLYVPFFNVMPQIHKELLCVLLVVAGMLALRHAIEGGRAVAIAGAGLALAGVAMVRMEYGWIAIALLLVSAVWALRRRTPEARRLVAVAAVAVLGCVPWLAYTYHVTGEPLYWGSSSGLSLYWMSPTLPGETGQWHSPREVLINPALVPYRPFFRSLDELGPVRADRALRDRALENIRDRPLTYLRNVAANTSRLFFAMPFRPARPFGTVLASIVFNGLLLIGIAWAARILWRRRRSLPPEAGPIALFAVLAVGVHLPPSASPRMLLPVVPALVWLIATAAHARVRPAGRTS